MTDTKLILLEGMPSTGKTTNSQFLQIQLELNGSKAKWIHEIATPHPTALYNEIGFSLNDQYKKLALEKWTRFTEKVLSSESEIYILDSAFFQYQIFWFLLNNAPYADLERFISEIFDIIKPLNPCLIYLYRKDTEATIDYLEKERGTKDLENGWERDKSQPYYRNKSKGAEGRKQFLRDYASLAGLLFDHSLCKKKSIEISKGNFAYYEKEMLSFLEIERMSCLEIMPENGVYRNEEFGFEIKVEGTVITDPYGNIRKFIPKQGNEFYAERLPVILRFEKPGEIIISGMQICERWTTIGIVYKKQIKN